MQRLQLLSPARISLAALLLLLCGFSVQAQETTEPIKKKTMTIRITEEVDGEVTERVIELPDDAEFNLEETLEDLELQEEIDGMVKDQNIEIIIRKKELENELKEMHIEVERAMKEMETDLAVEMEELQRHLESLHLEMENAPKRPLLGVHFEMGSQAEGAEVIKVVPGSGAEKAGMQAGDLITAVDGQPVNALEDLPNIIGGYAPGDEVEITYLRDGQSQKTLATLGEGGPASMKIMRFGDGEEFDFNFDFDFDDAEGTHKFEWHGDGDGFHRFHNESHHTFLGIVPDTDFDANGVKVERTIEETTAAGMELQQGDVITGINGNAVNNLKDLREALVGIEPGENYSVEFTRNGVPLKAEGTAQAKKSEDVFIKKIERHHGEPGHATTKTIRIRINVDQVSDEEKEALAKANENFSTDNSLDDAEIKLYPNPNDGKFKLDLSLTEAAPVTFRVFDITGNQVYAETIADFNGGVFSREVDISREAKGTYFLQITQNGKSTTRKVVTE